MKQVFRALVHLIRSPGLLVEAVRAAWALRPIVGSGQPSGIHRWDYYRWRLFTAYGDENATPVGTDLTEFLRWRQRQRT